MIQTSQVPQVAQPIPIVQVSQGQSQTAVQSITNLAVQPQNQQPGSQNSNQQIPQQQNSTASIPSQSNIQVQQPQPQQSVGYDSYMAPMKMFLNQNMATPYNQVVLAPTQ